MSKGQLKNDRGKSKMRTFKPEQISHSVPSRLYDSISITLGSRKMIRHRRESNGVTTDHRKFTLVSGPASVTTTRIPHNVVHTDAGATVSIATAVVRVSMAFIVQ